VHRLAESNALPPLFAWLPGVFAATAIRSSSIIDRTGRTDPLPRDKRVIINFTFVHDPIDVPMMEVKVDRVNYVFSFTSSVWQLSVQQLSSMATPSSSELSSPQLLRTMCSGLRDLLIPPLILLIFGGKGLQTLLSIQEAEAEAEDSKSNSRPLSDWVGLLSTWLDLEIFAMNRSTSDTDHHRVDRSADWLLELLPTSFEIQSDDLPSSLHFPYELNILSTLPSGLCHQQQVLLSLQDVLRWVP